MTYRKTIAVVVLAVGPAMSVQAVEPLSASYIEAAYLNSTQDTGTPPTDEVEGFRTQVSVGLMPSLNFIGDFDQRRYQNTRDSFGSAGLAVHTLGPVWQAFGAVTYEYAEFDDNLSSAGDHEEQGFGVAAGGRAVLPNIEFHAAYKYFDLGNVAPDVALTGARYGAGLALDLSSWWSLTADYTVRTHEAEDSTAPSSTAELEWQEWSVGFRRYFATQTDRRARKGGLLTGLFSDDDDAAAEAQ